MFWILGGDALVHAIHRTWKNDFTDAIATQFDHCAWEGFHFYDLIFPLFVFIAGVSQVFSLNKIIEKEGRSAAVMRLLRRCVLLMLLGILYYGGLADGWEHVRLLGVLQRIGLASTFAGLLYCFYNTRGLILACLTLLIGYWALLTFVPIRDIKLEKNALKTLTAEKGIADERQLFEQTPATLTGSYEPGRNLTNHFDYQYLPLRKWNTYYDPEGILSTLPAIATCLLGIFAGLLLHGKEMTPNKKCLTLLLGGALAIGLGYLWGQQFPVIKNIWTSTFVLVAGGWSAILLGVFYWSVDIRGWKAWTVPFIWIGMNAITIYLSETFINYQGLAKRIIGGPISKALDVYLANGAGGVAVAAFALGIIFLFTWYLYRKQIFLRV